MFDGHDCSYESGSGLGSGLGLGLGDGDGDGLADGDFDMLSYLLDTQQACGHEGGGVGAEDFLPDFHLPDASPNLAYDVHNFLLPDALTQAHHEHGCTGSIFHLPGYVDIEAHDQVVCVSTSSSCSSLETLDGASASSNDGSAEESRLVLGLVALEKKRKAQDISGQDRMSITRTRNREHARLTRKRRKQQVEQMKQELAQLLMNQRKINPMPSARTVPAAALALMDKRLNIAATFFQMLWSDTGTQANPVLERILAPEFVLKAPHTLEAHAPTKPQHVEHADTFSSLADQSLALRAFLCRAMGCDTLGQTNTQAFLTTLDESSAIFEDGILMCCWTVEPARPSPNPNFKLEGMLEARFAPNYLLKSAVVVFDTSLWALKYPGHVVKPEIADRYFNPSPIRALPMIKIEAP